jgi:hypothetical protein
MDSTISAKKSQLVAILEAICRELELTPTQYKNAEEKYNAVGAWLAGGGMLAQYDPLIFAHGSIALETSVRPLRRAEFDVDLISHLQNGSDRLQQKFVKQLIGNRLLESKIYRDMLEEKNRCWCLNYAGEFHMDITPAVRNSACRNGGLAVPDRKLQRWKPTNPKAFVALFNQIASLVPRVVSAKVHALNEAFAEATEPLPERKFSKSVLRRGVQLLKRHRDVYFYGKDYAPVSIIITTLAAQAYAHLVTSNEYDNEFDLLIDVVKDMPTFIRTTTSGGQVYYDIPNPTTQGENFADKWNARPDGPKLANAFFTWHEAVKKDIEALTHIAGLDEIERNLTAKFGPDEISRAMRSQRQVVNVSRLDGSLKLHPSSGLGIAGSLSVARNTFFGR